MIILEENFKWHSALLHLNSSLMFLSRMKQGSIANERQISAPHASPVDIKE